MGLIFRKYAIYRFCTNCKTKYVDELTVGESFIRFYPSWEISEKTRKRFKPKANFVGKCEKCNHDLQPLNESDIYYILRGTDHKIPNNSFLAFLFVKIPSIVFGFLGIIPFMIFFIKGISNSYDGFRLAFLEVYEVLITKIFGVNYFRPIFILLSIYFVSRILIFMYRFIKYS